MKRAASVAIVFPLLFLSPFFSPCLVMAEEAGPWMRLEIKEGLVDVELPGGRTMRCQGPASVEGFCEDPSQKLEQSSYRVVYGETSWRFPKDESGGKVRAGALELAGAEGRVDVGCPSILRYLSKDFAYARFEAGQGTLRFGGRGRTLRAGEMASAYGTERSWFTTGTPEDLVPPREGESIGKIIVELSKSGRPTVRLRLAEGLKARAWRAKPALTSFSRRPVLHKYECDFFPNRYRFSVSDDGRSGDWAELGFPEDPKRLPSQASTHVEAGAQAYVRFFVAGGHVVILAPGSRARVSRSFKDGHRRHRLEMIGGMAWLSPREEGQKGPRPEIETDAARDPSAPLDVVADRRFIFHRGTCLLLAPRVGIPWSLALLPCPFEEGLMERSKNFGPTLETLRGETADLLEGWLRHGRGKGRDVLQRLAAYEKASKPVFTLSRPLPDVPAAFGDGFSWHLSGDEHFDYFQAVASGNPDSLAIQSRFEGRGKAVQALEVLAGGEYRFSPLQGLHQVAVMGAMGVELATLAFLDNSKLQPLPGIRRTTNYFMHASIGNQMGDLFDRPLKREENLTKVDRAVEVLLEKVDDNPFLTCLIAMSTLGLSVYMALKGPRAAILSIWRIITFFRGIMCKQCDMGMDVVPLCELPYDHRMAHLRGYFEAAAFENIDEVREALEPVLLDLEGVEPPGDGHARMEGLATWCPKCHAGELLFRAHRGGNIVEEASYPLASEGFFRTMEMKHQEKVKRAQSQ